MDCLSQVTEQNGLRFTDIVTYLKMYVDEEEMQMYIEIIKELNYKLSQERIKNENAEIEKQKNKDIIEEQKRKKKEV